MTDANDDLATYVPPYKVIACLPVNGRLPLLKNTIDRLFGVNGCAEVICSGDGVKERELCESLGAVWVPHQNKPLGSKWNAAFMKAAEYKPDAVVYVGSSDWLSGNWFRVMRPYVEKYGFTGVPGCHFLDVGSELRLCYWPGYKFSKYHKERGDETIGIGRMISAQVMDKIGWQPFDPKFDNSLDRSMKDRIRKYCKLDDHMVNANIQAVSLSTSRWENKHNFEHHWADAIPSERVLSIDPFLQSFPEAYQLYENLAGVHK